MTPAPAYAALHAAKQRVLLGVVSQRAEERITALQSRIVRLAVLQYGQLLQHGCVLIDLYNSLGLGLGNRQLKYGKLRNLTKSYEILRENALRIVPIAHANICGFR